jgi:hypothetical protein
LIQRKAEHFEILPGLLKVFAHAPEAGRPDAPSWRQRADVAIAKAGAILAGDRDPEVAEGPSWAWIRLT